MKYSSRDERWQAVVSFFSFHVNVTFHLFLQYHIQYLPHLVPFPFPSFSLHPPSLLISSSPLHLILPLLSLSLSFPHPPLIPHHWDKSFPLTEDKTWPEHWTAIQHWQHPCRHSTPPMDAKEEGSNEDGHVLLRLYTETDCIPAAKVSDYNNWMTWDQHQDNYYFLVFLSALFSHYDCFVSLVMESLSH